MSGSRLRSRAGMAGLVLVLIVGSVAGCVTGPPAAGVLTETFHLPAFSFAPAGEDGDESNGSRRAIPRPSGDIAVREITWALVDGSGAEIPVTDHRIHFHHVVLFNTKHDDMACPRSSSLGGRWAAPGGERTPFRLPEGYGYFTSAADVWSANWHIMNLTDQRQEGIRVRYTVSYTRSRQGLRDVTPYWWDQAGCYSSGTIQVPGGGEPEIYERSRTFTVRRGGFIKAVRSHLHDGGIDVTLRTSSGRVICRSTAVYHTPPAGEHAHDGDEHGHGTGEAKIVQMPLCADLHVRVEEGQRLTSTVRYRNDRAQSDAMGSNLVWIAEDPPPPTTTTTRTTRPPTTAPPPTTDEGEGPAR
jgi:hypothetical protein